MAIGLDGVLTDVAGALGAVGVLADGPPAAGYLAALTEHLGAVVVGELDRAQPFPPSFTVRAKSFTTAERFAAARCLSPVFNRLIMPSMRNMILPIG